MSLQGITIFCFAASYSVALVLELFQLLRPGLVRRVILHGFAAAGLLAHTLFLIYRGHPLSGQPTSLLFLSWILAIFYLYGSIHYRRLAWGVFVLPVVLSLILAGWLVRGPQPSAISPALGEHLQVWVWLHSGLLVLGAVGLCVGFVASVMYLVQSWKLKHKLAPGEGLQLLSLERLEAMNRRGINLAFPLFTAGLLIGVALLWSTQEFSWWDPKVLATGLLWLVFVVLLYLRYGLHLRGRRVALWTIAAFGFLMVAFVVAHRFGGGL
jgi:ABC-type transport system involved in cytochrome c biogenesis permease subunit